MNNFGCNGGDVLSLRKDLGLIELLALLQYSLLFSPFLKESRYSSVYLYYVLIQCIHKRDKELYLVTIIQIKFATRF